MTPDLEAEIYALRILLMHLKGEIERQQKLARAQEEYFVASMNARMEIMNRIDKSLEALSRENPSPRSNAVQ